MSATTDAKSAGPETLHARSKSYRRIDRSLSAERLPSEGDIEEYLKENNINTLPPILTKRVEDLTVKLEAQAARLEKDKEMKSRREMLRRDGHEKVLQMGEAAAQFFFDEGAQALSTANLLQMHLTWADNLLQRYEHEPDIDRFRRMNSLTSFDEMLKPSRFLFFGDENARDTNLLRDIPLNEEALRPYRQVYEEKSSPRAYRHYMDLKISKYELRQGGLLEMAAEKNEDKLAEDGEKADEKTGEKTGEKTATKTLIGEGKLMEVLVYNPFKSSTDTPSFEKLCHDKGVKLESPSFSSLEKAIPAKRTMTPAEHARKKRMRLQSPRPQNPMATRSPMAGFPPTMPPMARASPLSQDPMATQYHPQMMAYQNQFTPVIPQQMMPQQMMPRQMMPQQMYQQDYMNYNSFSMPATEMMDDDFEDEQQQGEDLN